MGNSPTHLPQPPDAFRYAVIAIRKRDRFRLLHFDERDVQLIRKVFDEFWPAGVKKTSTHASVVEFKVNGQPFITVDRAIVSTTASLIKLQCRIFVELRLAGYHFLASPNLSHVRDLGSCLWRHSQRLPLRLNTTADFLRARCDHYTAAVHFQAPNIILLVNASRHTHQSFVNHLQNTILFDIDEEGSSPTRVEQLTLHTGDVSISVPGNPWSEGNDVRQMLIGRRILLEIVRYFDDHQMPHYGSVNVNGASDTLFFQKNREFLSSDHQYSCISIHAPDRLTFVDIPVALRDACKKAVLGQWKKGLRRIVPFKAYGAYEIHLNNTPWMSNGDDGIRARLMIVAIIQSCYSLGWRVLTAVHLVRDGQQRTTFVLQRSNDCDGGGYVKHICLCPMESSRLLLLDGPVNIVVKLTSTLKAHWLKGIASKGATLRGQEWRLRGQPWDASAELSQDMRVQHLISVVVHELYVKGWHLICTFDAPTRYRGQEPMDVQSLVFAELDNVTSECSSIGSRQRNSIGRSHSSNVRKKSAPDRVSVPRKQSNTRTMLPRSKESNDPTSDTSSTSALLIRPNSAKPTVRNMTISPKRKITTSSPRKKLIQSESFENSSTQSKQRAQHKKSVNFTKK